MMDNNNIHYVLHEADGRRKGIHIAKQLCEQGHRHLIVVGGDGTINEVVNGIFLSGVDTKEVNLAVIPHGRGNDWARTHSYPKSFSKCVNGFLQGNFTIHDVGLTKVFKNENLVEKRYFININSYCFSAEVIFNTSSRNTKIFSKAVYFLGIFKSLVTHKYLKTKITADKDIYEGEPFMFVVANCQYNGGGMQQAPQALYDDGLFDIVVVPKLSPLRVITSVHRIYDGSHIKVLKGVEFFRSKKVIIESNPYIKAEMEGELIEQGRYEIEMLPSCLNMMTFNRA